MTLTKCLKHQSNNKLSVEFLFLFLSPLANPTRAAFSDIAYKGNATASTNTDTKLTLTKPSTASTGDVFVTQITITGGSTTWSGAAQGPDGWYITGIHNVSCTGVTDCRAGDLAYVPFGQLTNSSSWAITDNFVPASDNISDLALMQNGGSNWDIYTKVGGPYGSNQIEQLTAASIAGPWTISNTWDAPFPSGTVTYNVAVHPEQTSPDGQVVVSYNVNGVSSDYHALFMYLPK